MIWFPLQKYTKKTSSKCTILLLYCTIFAIYLIYIIRIGHAALGDSLRQRRGKKKKRSDTTCFVCGIAPLM